METVRKPLNEDRVALLLGSVIFILALLKFSGIDMLGWAVKIGMWVGDPLDAGRPRTQRLPRMSVPPPKVFSPAMAHCSLPMPS